MPPAAPAQPVAGPSTELGLRPLPRFDSGYSGILTGALQAIDATWQALSDRRSYLVQEILLLDRVITGATCVSDGAQLTSDKACTHLELHQWPDLDELTSPVTS